MSPPNRPWAKWLSVIAALTLLASLPFAEISFAADPCTDADIDGWGVSSPPGCDPSALSGLGDCNDGDAAIHPGAAEVCGDDKDNDCDVDVDFGLKEIGYLTDPHTGMPVPVVGLCIIHSPEGCMPAMSCVPDSNCCSTVGTKQCNANLDGIICVSIDPDLSIRTVHPEGPAGTESCFDFTDNDCDGCFDHEDPACQTMETCNNFDDDNDGLIDEDFALGLPCSTGVGECHASGVTICSPTGGTECSAHSKVPGVEAPPAGPTCLDGKDNDCDSKVDLADPDCQRPEVCDGLDNDGDGLRDEDFTDKGDPCSTGEGACHAIGTRICRADGSGTTCDAVPNLAAVGVEGPAGKTCGDGVDNDCDGVMDGSDPGCGSAGIAAQCALIPLQNTANGGSCEGYYRLMVQTSGAGPDAVVRAELLGLTPEGEELVVQPARNGEVAHLVSRVDRKNWKFELRPNKRNGMLAGIGNWHEIYAPVPILRVRVKDALNEAVAYCSPVSYLDVVRPSGGVVNGTSGAGTTDVLTALPLVQTGSLKVKVNGVDIFKELGINPATDFPGTHAGGVVNIGGVPVTISNIVVDMAPTVDLPSSNTLRMSVAGLGCGGNEVVVDGDNKFIVGTNLGPTNVCLVDDTHDCGSSSVFQLTIDSPTPGEIVPTIPTPVMGEICHGQPIAKASINGKQLDTALQTETASGLECAGGTHRLTIDTTLPQTNLFAEAVGATTELGTFDPGSNRLIASAVDDDANRIYKSFLFAVGNPSDIIPAGVGARRPSFAYAPAAGSTVPDSFVFGLEGSALNEFFSSTCQRATACVQAQIRRQLETCLSKPGICEGGSYEGFPCTECTKDFFCEHPFLGVPGVCMPPVDPTPPPDGPSPDYGCEDFLQTVFHNDDLCDPCLNVKVAKDSFELREPMTCSIALVDGPGPGGSGGEIVITLTVPQLHFGIHAGGDCHGDFWAANLTVDVDADVTLPKDDGARTTVTFGIKEENLENPSTPRPEPVTNAGSGVGLVEITDFGDTDLSGWGVAVIEFFAGVDDQEYLRNLPRAYDLPLLKDSDLGGKALTDDLPEVKPEEGPFEVTDKMVDTSLVDVQINSQGLRAVTDISIEPTTVDPGTEPSPGFFATPAPPPMPPIDGGNAFIAVSDDLLNAALAAATTQGQITSEGCSGALATGACCASSPPKTVGSLFPANCNDIMDGPPITDCTLINAVSGDITGCMRAVLVGTCLGIRAGDLAPAAAQALCESYEGNAGFNDTAEIVGQAVCHGVRGADCSSIPIPAFSLGTEKLLCKNIPALHVKASDPILTCVRNDVPPAFLLKDVPGTDPVEAMLRLNDLLAGFLVDRDHDGFDGGELIGIPSCLKDGTTNDCRLLSMCLDLNLEASMLLGGPSDAPELQFNLGAVMPLERVEGEACEGDVDFKYTSDAEAAEEATTSDSVEDSLVANTVMATPVQKPGGISLGGVVTFTDPKLFAIKTSSTPGRCFNDLSANCNTSADCGGMECVLFQDYVGVKGTIVAEPLGPPDPDGDGKECDNCPNDWNEDQLDSDMDGRGDVCDACPLDPANTCP